LSVIFVEHDVVLTTFYINVVSLLCSEFANWRVSEESIITSSLRITNQLLLMVVVLSSWRRDGSIRVVLKMAGRRSLQLPGERVTLWGLLFYGSVTMWV